MLRCSFFVDNSMISSENSRQGIPRQERKGECGTEEGGKLFSVN